MHFVDAAKLQRFVSTARLHLLLTLFLGCSSSLVQLYGEYLQRPDFQERVVKKLTSIIEREQRVAMPRKVSPLFLASCHGLALPVMLKPMCLPGRASCLAGQ
jgi:hypothetical protein